MTSFSDLGVPAGLVSVLSGMGIESPFPIQEATLPDSLAGRDVLGRGRTGSGKTYAFAIPLVARLAASGTPRRPGRPRALILAPTRELATQIDATLAPLAKAAGLRTLTIFGGVGANPQIRGLRDGVDVVVACPGRLDDHIRNNHASLDSVEITVLDEADHMADLGFLPVVRRLMDGTPRTGQRMLFSATLDNGIDVLVKRFLPKPVTHHVDSAAEAPVQMSHHVLHVRADDRFPVLVDLVAAPGRSVVFTRTKRRAKTLTKQLVQAGVPAVELHGNLAQNARNRNLSAFSEGTAATLVATDIAARGIHVDDVALVIHADPPVEHKAYLHRSGRTARAGAQGTVITLMTDDQQGDVRDLTRKAGIKPTTTRTRPGDEFLSRLAPGERTFLAPAAAAAASAPAPAPRTGGGNAGGSGSADGEGAANSGRPRRRRGGNGNGGRPAAAGHEQGNGGGQPAGGRSQGGRAQGSGGRSQGGRTQGSGSRTQGSGSRSQTTYTSESSPRTQGSSTRTGQSAGRSAASGTRTGQGGSSSGGAAAFSSGTRAGRRSR